jgi:hypothetical protein
MKKRDLTIAVIVILVAAAFASTIDFDQNKVDVTGKQFWTLFSGYCIHKYTNEINLCEEWNDGCIKKFIGTSSEFCIEINNACNRIVDNNYELCTSKKKNSNKFP